jgi:hypothetical protein
VTTNYDQLFEEASAASRIKVSVLPYDPSADNERWVLKMHGCISHPQDIVLTRVDYLRYESRRAALMGIVQSLLITKVPLPTITSSLRRFVLMRIAVQHMLFVGFGMTDDNFHRCDYAICCFDGLMVDV